MADEDDVALLEAWRRGDAAAGERLVKRHFDSLCRFLGAGEATADLVQSTWTACVARRDHIPEGTPFRAFLFGVARKELLMMLRKRYRGERAVTRAAAAPVIETSPSQELARSERQRLLHWALRRIPADARMVIQLAYWDELPQEQIAAIFEIPTGTVKSRLHRARALLRGAMESGGVGASLIDTTLHELDRAPPA